MGALVEMQPSVDGGIDPGLSALAEKWIRRNVLVDPALGQHDVAMLLEGLDALALDAQTRLELGVCAGGCSELLHERVELEVQFRYDRLRRLADLATDADMIFAVQTRLTEVAMVAAQAQAIPHEWEVGSTERVYVIAQLDRLKIGYTSRPVEVRLAEHQTSSGHVLELLGSIPGNMATERHIHGLLAEHRLHGEWFSLNEATKGWLRDVEIWED